LGCKMIEGMKNIIGKANDAGVICLGREEIIG
jgi:hypothetical protein